MTFREFSKYLSRELSNIYTDKRERQNIVVLLLSYHSGLDRSGIMLRDEEPVPETIVRKVNESLVMLKENVPIQYVTGETWFHDLRIRVNPDVLIPRPETEELVEIVSNIPLAPNSNILEIGTGSGCIALALKKLLPKMKVTATDISLQALKTASENAIFNKLDVKFEYWDISQIHQLEQEKFDLIISNPPYIPPNERMTLELHVRNQEPGMALFTPNDDPMHFYRIISRKARYMITNNGLLAFECHTDHAENVADVVEQSSWAHVKVKKDINGKNRFVLASLQ